MQISINTPALLFPAIKLLMLAYTNRFLALANLIRNLHTRYKQSPLDKTSIINQIHSLRKRIRYIKNMQAFGVISFFLCVLCMMSIYLEYETFSFVIFGLSLASLMLSLALSITEIFMSTKALEIELSDMELMD
jgi:hypothetical protein